nr:hypothetical protein [Tanacetum cinerariifolium]
MVAYPTKSDASEGFTQIIDFLNGSYIKYALTVNLNIYVSCIKQFQNTVAIQQVNDDTRLQALVDKKKVVITEAAIREVLHLDDAEGVDCFPNEEIFTDLARMGYENPSTKLTFYKAFFSSQWKFLIYTILQCMSAKRTSWRVGKGFSGDETPLFEGMLVGQEIEEEGDADEHVEDDTTGDDAHGDDTAAHGKVPTVTQEPSIPSPTLTIPPSQPPQDIPLTSQVQHTPPQLPQRVDTSDDTVMDDESNQGRMIDEMDKDDVVVMMDDKEEDKKVEEAKVDESAQVQGRQADFQAKIYKIDMGHANKVLSMQEAGYEPAEVQEVVDVVTTAKLIIEVVTAASGVVIKDIEEDSTTSEIIPAETKSKDKGKGILVEKPKPLKKKQQIKMDEEYARKLHAELNKDIDWDVAINHVKLKAKEDPALDYFKGMSYDDIRPMFEAKFNLNMDFLLKTKEQMEEEENRALQTINETSAKKAAKRRKLNKEMEDLKREDLEALWNLVKERFSTSKPNNFSDDFLLTTLGAMFEKPDALAQVGKNQRTIHGQAKFKSWKLLESCGVHIITFTTTQLILLVERRYPLSRFTLDQMLNAVRLQVKEESEVSLELLRFTRQQHQERQLE